MYILFKTEHSKQNADCINKVRHSVFIHHHSTDTAIKQNQMHFKWVAVGESSSIPSNVPIKLKTCNMNPYRPTYDKVLFKHFYLD